MFENILGNDEAKRCLEQDIKYSKISHAYIFSGMEAIGKRLIALEFAKNILQTNNLETTPDFKYIDIKEGKKEILAEQIREEIIDDVYIAPAISNKKVYIINNAEKMNKTASNAILKTLEEPPETIVIILITNNINKIIPTILSRAKKLEFVAIESEHIETYLKNKFGDVEKDVIDFTCGSLGQAIKIIELLKQDKSQSVDKLIQAILEKDKYTALKEITTLDFQDNDIIEIFTFKLYQNKLYKEILKLQELKMNLENMVNQELLKTEYILKII